MQDIVYRPRPSSKQKQSLEVKSLTSSPKIVLFVEQILRLASLGGGYVQNIFGEERDLIVISAPKKAPLLTYANSEMVQSKLYSSSKPKFGQTLASKEKLKLFLKKKSLKTREGLQTPLGKLAFGQLLVIILLFSLTLYSYSRTVSKTIPASNLNRTLARNTLREYLPLAEDAVQAKTYQAQDVATPTVSVPLHAWVTPWDMADIHKNAQLYISLSAFWLTLNPDGWSVSTKADWGIWQKFKKSLSSPKKIYYLTVSGNPEDVVKMLDSSQLQKKHIASLLKNVETEGFDGIDLDYEGLGLENQAKYSQFIRQLTVTFHADHKLVALTLEARVSNQEPMDWQTLGSLVDQIRIMAYDYHSSQVSLPGAIAPIGWLKEILDYAEATISPQKIIIGLGNYGYDWQQAANGSQSWHGLGLSYDQAMATAKQENAPIKRASGIDNRGYDIGSVPYFTYQDKGGNKHSVWFEDSASLQAKLNLVSQYNTAGIIFWSVGLGDQVFWQKEISN